MDEQQVSAAVSNLNSKLYGILAVRLPYHLKNFPGNNIGLAEKLYTDRNIANSEALCLRGASLADRLDATSVGVEGKVLTPLDVSRLAF